MVAIWLTCSHVVGMGHFFRALVLADALRRRGARCLVLLEDYEPARRILREREVPFEIIDPRTAVPRWEGAMIGRREIRVWIDDRLATDAEHATAVKNAGATLVTMDDRGPGASLSDLHIAPLLAIQGEQPAGGRVLTDLRYLVLNPEIERFRRRRNADRRTLVSLGGTDTHGLTPRVMGLLALSGRSGTVITGPGFAHDAELDAACAPSFAVKRSVPSLVEEMSHYDSAVTGTGVTSFEAAASGLPTITIANEQHEVACGRFLEKLGCTVFAGHRAALDEKVFTRSVDIAAMSEAGLRSFTLKGVENVCEEVLAH